MWSVFRNLDKRTKKRGDGLNLKCDAELSDNGCVSIGLVWHYRKVVLSNSDRNVVTNGKIDGTGGSRGCSLIGDFSRSKEQRSATRERERGVVTCSCESNILLPVIESSD